MNKKILLAVLTLALAIVFTFALVSCNSSEEPTQKPTETPTENPAESCAHAYDNSCDADCNLCGETREASHTAKTVDAVAPTCTQTGLTEGSVCSVCNATITEQKTVAAKGHTEIIDMAVPASCSKEGLTQGSHCDVCGEVIVAQNAIDKTAHLATDIPAVSPTCTETGLSKGEKCLVCGEITKEQTVIEARGHKEVVIPAVAPNCTETGLTEGTKCSVCKATLVEPQVVDALGHSIPEKYSYDKDNHWIKCSRITCGAVIEKGAHNIHKYNCTVCDYYNGPAVKDDTVYMPAKSLDTLFVAYDQIAGTGMNVSVKDVLNIDLPFGESVRINGWIGFQMEIKSFGYWFNDDVYNVKMSDTFFMDTEDTVLEVGGQYARRFSIAASTAGMENATSVSFIALLDDGTYVVFKKINIVMTGGPQMGEIIPDDEIEKAGPETLTGGEKFVAYKLNTGNNMYKTGADLKYMATGTGMTFNGKFNLSGSLKIEFEQNYDRFAEDFNKYKISYSSTAPLKAIVVYTDGTTTVTDVIYLEAGDHMFSCLTLGYINGIYAKNITSIDIQVLGPNNKATFVLYDVTTECVDVVSGSVTYLVNERYALGIKLTWGGGISYFLDKEDNNSDIGNLVNCADAGRLIQQSYYGTQTAGDNGYELGEFHDNAWGYNPVQGGNKYNEPSRLIDIQVYGLSIYVKAQPRDWAKHDLTSSYMENVYTLYSNRVQVDNRFIDFSGFQHNPWRAQELPAFYTIGYLNTFVYYNGKAPWTGDTLKSDNTLGFWTEDLNATKRLLAGNTETWCAWINGDSDYGIGLYTPNLRAHFAGRLNYDITPDEVDSTAQACSYVAAIQNLKLASYHALEYSYLITTGSTQEIRDLFTEHKDFADNADLTSDVFQNQE